VAAIQRADSLHAEVLALEAQKLTDSVVIQAHESTILQAEQTIARLRARRPAVATRVDTLLVGIPDTLEGLRDSLVEAIAVERAERDSVETALNVVILNVRSQLTLERAESERWREVAQALDRDLQAAVARSGGKRSWLRDLALVAATYGGVKLVERLTQ